MNIKKLAPWNWFKKEEEDAAKAVPVRGNHTRPLEYEQHPVTRIHREIDRMFDSVFRDVNRWPMELEGSGFPAFGDDILKPTVDIGATEKAYTISVEIPGVDEKEIHIELSGNALTIRGEKRQETADEERNFYRIERAYGAFQRVLSLPEDAVQEEIRARFKKGVLTITVPRKSVPKADVRRIEVHRGE